MRQLQHFMRRQELLKNEVTMQSTMQNVEEQLDPVPLYAYICLASVYKAKRTC